jgi:two-component system sensor histidine kinase MprB
VITNVAERVARAVTNVIDNARKWSPAGATVEIRLGGGVLRVRDYGPGFAPADLPCVFDRFYRADAARRMPGTGLGLAIVKHTAEVHGGSVAAANAGGGDAQLDVSFGPVADLGELRPSPLGPQPATG